MIKLILVTAMFSLTQLATAELGRTNTDAINGSHSKIIYSQGKPKLAEHSDIKTWTKDQTKQVDLEKKYKKEIATNPDNKKTYSYLAGLYLSNNMSSKAIEAYQDAIIHDPTNPKLFAAISIAYLHKAKYSMAKAMADEALRLDPNLKGVKKINEYVIAKKEAIEAASKIPAGGSKMDMTGDVSHGSVIPTASGVIPTDSVHKPK
jgi:tetratricopeptide (TPR) repeat protein